MPLCRWYPMPLCRWDAMSLGARSSWHPRSDVVLRFVIEPREKLARSRRHHRSAMCLGAELLDGLPRIPSGDGDELHVGAGAATQEVCAEVTVDAMNAGKDVGLQQLLVRVSI